MKPWHEIKNEIKNKKMQSTLLGALGMVIALAVIVTTIFINL